jgi:hypothetical protein
MSTDKSSESFDTGSTCTKLSLYTNLNARPTFVSKECRAESGDCLLVSCIQCVSISAVVLWISLIWDRTLPQRIIESRYFEGSTFPRHSVALFVLLYFVYLFSCEELTS